MQLLKSGLFLCLVGCAANDAAAVSEATQGLTCPVPTIDVARSLAITDAEVLAKFSFKRVMAQIASSASASNTPLAIYRDWMTTFADCDNPKIDPNHYDVVCPRLEAQFAELNPFDPGDAHFVPVALTNRFDLAPKSGADCGEYRGDFALVNASGRGFINFEARLPNPNPAAGLAGCAPVAELWAQLSTDADVASRAAKLEQFYFSGLPGFEPVVAAAHYGLAVDGGPHGKGQIRTNFFAQLFEWQLREFQLAKPCAATATCALAVEHVTVKVNPANELFDGTHDNAPAFQAAFLAQIPALSRGNPATIAMSTGNDFNEFESVEVGDNVLFANFTQSSFRRQIRAAITNPNLTVQNVLDRASTQTCAGCHELSAGDHAHLGDGVEWPRSLGFVHIDEQRHLSPALTTTFLPRRSQVLTAFLEAQCRGGLVTDDGTNLAGGALDAAN